LGRLFWKFLLSYWAALLLAVFGVAGAAWLYRLADQSPRVLDSGPLAAWTVASAAATLRYGGAPALRELVEAWGGPGAVPLFAVDDGGRDLLGHSIPPQALARARRIVGTGSPSDGVRSVRLPDGRAYLLFMPFGARRMPSPFLARPPFPLVPLAIGALASLAFGALLALYVARPIRHLREAFAELSLGRFATRVTPRMGRRRDEVADLGRDFDRMAQRVEALVAAQRSLLHDVSHELRSPLARLQVAIGLIRQDPRRLGVSLDRIEQEIGRLDELVGQVLTWSRLSAGVTGGWLGGKAHVDIADLAASIASDAKFEAQASGRDVVFAAEREVFVEAHVELLHRAIENVVRNAVRFTPVGTAVEISVIESPQANECHVTVADRGPGVAVAELEAIFEPFYRSAERQAGGGSGLGLAIARRAVEAHGGRVRARNRLEGGLEIDIQVPLAVDGHDRANG
jgi:two-component system, OmpR family, sensor kinase